MVGFSLNHIGLFKTDRWDVFCKKCRSIGFNPETVKCIPITDCGEITSTIKPGTIKTWYKEFKLIGKPLAAKSDEEIFIGTCNKNLSKLKR